MLQMWEELLSVKTCSHQNNFVYIEKYSFINKLIKRMHFEKKKSWRKPLFCEWLLLQQQQQQRSSFLIKNAYQN